MSSNDNELIGLPLVEQSEIVHDEFVKIRRDRLRLPDNHRYNYYTLITPGAAVVVLGITPEGKFVLNEEYRHPAGEYLLSAAGGYLGLEEEPAIGAQRELLEETGFGSDTIVRLGSAYPYPGISGQKIYYCAALDVVYKNAPQLEPSEIIRTVVMTRNEVVEYIKQGKPVDGTLCTALFLYGIRL